MRQIAPQWIAVVTGFAIFASGCGDGKQAGLRAQARDALAAGNPDQARELLAQSISADPADPSQAPAYNDLGVVYQRLGRDEEAAIAYENSRRLDPLLPGPTYNLGVLLFQRGDDSRAATLLREAAEIDVADARPLEYAAARAIGAGRWEEAEELLDQARARAPDSPRVHSALGVARLHTRGAAEAMTNLLHALELNDQYAPAYFNLAVIHQDWLGDSDGAARYMNQYLAASPNDPHAASALDFIDAIRDAEPPIDPGQPFEEPSPASAGIDLPEPAAIDLADAPPAASSPDADLTPEIGTPEPFDGAQEPPRQPEDPEVANPPDRPPAPVPVRPPPARPRTVDGLLALAREEAGRGNTAQAYRTCREARVLADQLGDALVVERVLVTAVSLCRDQAGAHYDYGLYLMKLEQPEAALRSFKQAVGLAPQWVPAYLGMAETAIRTEQYAAAQIALQRALRIDPGNREATWGLAGLYDQHLRRPDEAISAYRDFLARYDSDSRAPAARARIAALQRHLVNTSSPDPGISDTAREPDPPAARLQIARPRVRNHKAAVEAYNRGTIYQAREDWDQAIFFYTRALEQDDTFALAYYNLGKVYQTRKDTDLAIEAYEASVSLQPRHINSRFNVALLYRELGRNDRAVQQLQGILQIEPNHARAHYLLGLVYSEDRRTHEQAVAYFQRFLLLSPNDRAAPAVRQWLADTR